MAITPDDVRALYPSASNLTDDEVQALIDLAQEIVDEDVKPVCTMTDARYDRLVTLLTCHFLSMRDNADAGGAAVRRSKQGDADESYSVPNDKEWGYGSTRWGQMALALDTCGALSKTASSRYLKGLFEVF